MALSHPMQKSPFSIRLFSNDSLIFTGVAYVDISVEILSGAPATYQWPHYWRKVNLPPSTAIPLPRAPQLGVGPCEPPSAMDDNGPVLFRNLMNAEVVTSRRNCFMALVPILQHLHFFFLSPSSVMHPQRAFSKSTLVISLTPSLRKNKNG